MKNPQGLPVFFLIISIMQSGKQHKKRIKAKRLESQKKAQEKAEKQSGKMRIIVNAALLRPNNSYELPIFVAKGYYEDKSFRCKDCGADEVWRATQQKWWYEVMKGHVWTQPMRCRSCRTKERARKAEARRIHQEGIAKKHNPE